MTERIDELEKYYQPIETIEVWIIRLFWSCVLLSIAVLYSDTIPTQWAQQIPGIIFVFVVLTHFILSLYNRFCLIPSAERQRRKQLLSDSFQVPLTPESTQGYYNNPIAPSIARLGANILESAFFAKRICAEMAKRERIKIWSYIIIWISIMVCRNTSIGFILILTQFIFSGEIIVKWLNLEVLRSRNEKIYNNLYSVFLHQVDLTKNSGISDILNSFASYEAAKEAASIKQSSKIFFKLNEELSKEWELICRKLKING